MRLLATLLVSAVTLAAAPAFADHCSRVREVRQMAQQQGLDGPNLAALEIRACGAVSPGGRSLSPLCRDLTIMATLSRMAGGEDGTAIQAAQSLACQVGTTTLERWPNGVRATSLTGTLYYPNGRQARTSTGGWTYPDGTVARSSSRVWYYPDGSRARGSDGTWYSPSGPRMGSATDLDTWTCRRLGDVECQHRLARAQEHQELALIDTLELIWLAHRTGG